MGIDQSQSVTPSSKLHSDGLTLWPTIVVLFISRTQVDITFDFEYQNTDVEGLACGREASKH